MTEFEKRARELGRRFGKESSTQFEHEMDILVSQNHSDFMQRFKELMDKHGVKPVRLD